MGNSARRKIPKIEVLVTRRRGAPRMPGKSELKEAFERAMALASPRKAPEAHGQERLSVNVLLIGDDEIAELNAQHMQHDGPTDVLSFPMGEMDLERGTFHLGDILVSFETAEREARARKLTTEEEVTRYCVHGFLHCLGYEDDTSAQRSAMFAVQERAVSSSFARLVFNTKTQRHKGTKDSTGGVRR